MDQSKYQSYWYHTSVGTDTSVLDSLSYALYIAPISSVSRHVFACLCKHYCSPNLHAQLAPPVLYCVLLLSCDSLKVSVSVLGNSVTGRVFTWYQTIPKLESWKTVKRNHITSELWTWLALCCPILFYLLFSLSTDHLSHPHTCHWSHLSNA